jgi:nuclear pore complex protein Nup107
VVLKSACRTWEDFLWAQVSILCEEKQRAEMLRLDGGFWEGGMTAVEKGVVIPSKEEIEQEELEWEKEVESALRSLSSVEPPEGYVQSYQRNTLC